MTLFLCWQSWIFNIITPVFSVTWSFRNHSNMLIWCFLIINVVLKFLKKPWNIFSGFFNLEKLKGIFFLNKYFFNIFMHLMSLLISWMHLGWINLTNPKLLNGRVSKVCFWIIWRKHRLYNNYRMFLRTN